MKERDSKFELLRILAMLMIIGSHLASHGVMHCLDQESAYILWSEGTAINQLFSAALATGGIVGVALFFMLTGYFMIYNDKIKLERVFCETFYYGIFAAILFAVSYLCGYHYSEVSTENLWGSILKRILIPVTGGSWWFITVYVFLMLLHSLINKTANKFNEKGFFFLLFITWVFWYSFGYALDASFFSIQQGIFFYLIGGYIRRFNIVEKVKKRKGVLILVILAAMLLHTSILYAGNWLKIDLTLKKEVIRRFITAFDTAIPIPAEATAIFLIFGSMDIKHNETINKIAATTFGVYLIHDSIYGRSLIWRGILKVDTFWYQSIFFPVSALCLVVVVFAVCSMIDLLRIKFIEPKMLKIVEIGKKKLSDTFCIASELK